MSIDIKRYLSSDHIDLPAPSEENQRALDTIAEIQGPTGDSKLHGSLLLDYDQLRERSDLTLEKRSKLDYIKIELDKTFGASALDVFTEWKRAEGVRNAAQAKQGQP